MSISTIKRIGQPANNQGLNFLENPEKFGYKKKLFSVTFKPRVARLFYNSFFEGKDSRECYIIGEFSRPKEPSRAYTDNLCGKIASAVVTTLAGPNQVNCNLISMLTFPYRIQGFFNYSGSEYGVTYYENFTNPNVTFSGYVLIPI